PSRPITGTSPETLFPLNVGAAPSRTRIPAMPPLSRRSLSRTTGLVPAVLTQIPDIRQLLIELPSREPDAPPRTMIPGPSIRLIRLDRTMAATPGPSHTTPE